MVISDFHISTLAGPIVFLHTPRPGAELVRPPPPRRLAPNWARASQKNERVGRYETQRLIQKFKVSGEPVTSQVRFMT